jgi:hypothetical protein
MSKFGETIDGTNIRESGKNNETLQSPEKSSSEMVEFLIQKASSEVVQLKQVVNVDLAQIEESAREKDIVIDNEDRKEMADISAEAETAIIEFSNEVGLETKNEKSENEALESLNALYEYIKDPNRYKRYEQEDEIIGNFIKSIGESPQQLSEFFKNPEMAPKATEALRLALIVENEKRPVKELKCQNCGMELLGGSGFCGECGNEIRNNNYTKFEPIFNELSKSLGSLEDYCAQVKSGHEKTDENIKFRNNIFYVVSGMLNSANIGSRIRASHWFKSHMADIDSIREKHITRDDGQFISEDFIGAYTIKNIITKTESIPLMKEVLKKSLQENDGSYVDVELDDLFNYEYSGNMITRRRDIAKTVAEEFGFSEEIVKKWDKAKLESKKDESGKEVTKDSFGVNSKALMELEKSMPGSAKILYDEFGIANFARYDKEDLLKQLELKDVDMPYGIVAFPEADWNGGFLSYNLKSELSSAARKLSEGGYTVRIVEAGSQFALARRMNKFHNKYSQAGNKIDFVILGGHGSKSTLQLGLSETSLPEVDTGPPPLESEFILKEEYVAAFEKWQKNLENEIDKQGKQNFDPRHTLQAEDLNLGAGLGIRRAAEKWLGENASIALISCSTGTEGGIAQEINNKLNLTTIGPDRPTSVNKIEISFDQNGKPVINIEYNELVEYGKAETKKYLSRDIEK